MTLHKAGSLVIEYRDDGDAEVGSDAWNPSILDQVYGDDAPVRTG